MNRGEKILVIDDNPVITRLLESVLTQEGYTVVSTNDSGEGEALAEREHPDLAVVDICMPGMDGWELCERIRGKRDVPILVLTVLPGPGDVERAFRAGADAYMTKPFMIQDLLERVRGLLQRRIRRLDDRD